MKTDPNLKVVPGQSASGSGRRPARQRTAKTSEGMVLLVSQANQQASRPDLTSLQEAQSLLADLLLQVENTGQETVEEVHRLPHHCLVRLW